jgi:hypothetical protein
VLNQQRKGNAALFDAAVAGSNMQRQEFACVVYTDKAPNKVL